MLIYVIKYKNVLRNNKNIQQLDFKVKAIDFALSFLFQNRQATT
jgi:hypothetical protein